MAANANMINANSTDIAQMDEQALRSFTQHLLQELRLKEVINEKLAFELATLKRLKFAAKSEAFNSEQRSLLEDALEEDLKAVAKELAALQAVKPEADASTDSPAVVDSVNNKPRRQPLPAHLPRTEFRHEPDNTTCRCGCALKRIGEDVSEKLDYTPGVFTVERHVRGKWACMSVIGI